MSTADRMQQCFTVSSGLHALTRSSVASIERAEGGVLMTNEQALSLDLRISNGGRVLHSWKEIASYTGRGVRTIQRYEMQLGFPVRRPSGSTRSAVLAFTNEIDAWLAHSPKRSESESKSLVLTHHRDAVCLQALHNRALTGLERAGAMHKRMEEMQTLVAQMNMRLKQCAERRKEMRSKTATVAQLAHVSREAIAGGGRIVIERGHPRPS